MQPKRYIVWSKGEIDLMDPFQKRWYYSQVLLNGRSEDVIALDWNEIKEYLPKLNLPANIYRLWESYFDARS